MGSAGFAQSTTARRWPARLSFVPACLAIVILVVLAELKSLAMFAVGLGAAGVSVAAAHFFLSRRGIVRWLSLELLLLLVPIAVTVTCARPAGRAVPLGAMRTPGHPRTETHGEPGRAAAIGRRPPRTH
ncbi:hypothetical protein ACF08M_28835 [Streptomyces sp. NPDC015032]|uniref:hypothetical protein n=1 Tax=Streptomyces sp. NPDC015032 TaxID=3364937 RepID=UPI0036F84DE3